MDHHKAHHQVSKTAPGFVPEVDRYQRRRWWALGYLTLAVFTVSLPATVLNVAIPTLVDALDVGAGALPWLVASYLLAFTLVLLPAGVLADRYGRRLSLLLGLGLFAAGSIAAACAPSAGFFIAAQVLSGAGAATVVTAVLALVTVIFAEDERPRAVGIWAAGAFLALPAGPILAGVVLNSLWWGWAFLLVVPVLAVVAAAVARTVPESRSVGTGGGRALAADLRPLLGRRRFLASSTLAALGMFVLFGVLFGAPQHFQVVLGVGPAGSGVRLLPLLAGVVTAGGLSGRLLPRMGARALIGTGFAVLAIALGLAAATVGPQYGFGSVAWMFAAGVGAGTTMAAASATALDEVGTRLAGVGSATFQVIQRIGGGLSALGCSAALTAGYRATLADMNLPDLIADPARESAYAGVRAAEEIGWPAAADLVRTAFAEGFGTMIWVCAAAAALGAAAAVLSLSRRGAGHRAQTERRRGGRADHEPRRGSPAADRPASPEGAADPQRASAARPPTVP